MARKRRRGASNLDAAVEQILQRIRESRNFDFRNYKRATLERRIERRMAELGSRSVVDYQSLLEREASEFGALIAPMLIKVTGFFRDKEMWDALSSKVIPRLLSEKRPGEEIRVWCAGCAAGEEAFSVALLLAEAMGPAFQNQEVKVFGTDADESAVAFARRGIYTREQVEAVPPEMLKNWFVEEAGGWAVRNEIRRAVVFGVNDLVSDAPIPRLDLLLCRNVFIYLDAQMQKRVLTRFHYALRWHGLLVLRKSELIPFAGKIFEAIDPQRRIYRKEGRRDAAVPQERLVSLLEQESVARSADEGQGESGPVDQFHRDVVQSTPLIATAKDGTILLWNAAARLWGRGENDVTGKKLASLNLSGLPGEPLIEKTAAVREGRSVSEAGSGTLSRAGDQGTKQISVEVTALRDAGHEVSGLLYAVQDVTAFRDMERDLRKANEERQSAYEELETTNEELQGANEELQTTNEELQTTNEELETTNEELETTNEELQSTNAELDATNRELAHRTEEMNSLGFVQRTTIRSLSAAVAVLDSSGRIKLWNLAAERLLGIPAAEAVGQLLWTLSVPALQRPVLQKMRKAVSQNAPMRAEQIGYELPNGSEGRATVAAVPIVDGGTVLGSVIIFEDATKMANLASELAALKGSGNNGKRSRR
ncbi:MAG TPA: CheR family methyltransferase [Myxococcales bacterium]|nr:CheR family methyltransferase [Myxococcales bacterium]